MNLNQRFKGLVDSQAAVTNMQTHEVLSDISDKSEIPYETLRNIYYSKVTDPKTSTTDKLARYFNLGINCMIGKCNHTDEERELLQLYRQCGHHGKSLIGLVARHEATVAKKEREAKGQHMVPCLVPVNRVDNGFIYEGSKTKEILTSVEEAYTAIEMISNAYAPAHCKGDIVLLADRYPEHGERALFVKDGIGFARDYFEEEGKHILRCITGHKKDMVLNRLDEVECIGTCVGVIRA